jgi:hypothetical protein
MPEATVNVEANAVDARSKLVRFIWAQVHAPFLA